MTTYNNLTPHVINMNDGRAFEPSGTVARCSQEYGTPDENGVCPVTFGDVFGVPEPIEGTIFIVSALVSKALASRTDVVSPATGHPHAVRNEKGHIVSVPFFVKEQEAQGTFSLLDLEIAFASGGNFEIYGEQPQIEFKYKGFEDFYAATFGNK